MSLQITIPSRFNGPPESGNGGYSCGVLAAQFDGAARVRLHVPPPLDEAMDLRRQADGTVAMYRDDVLVGTGASGTLDLDIPEPPSLPAAEAAEAGFICYDGHTFPTCFVCGPGRADHDGLELFPGPVASWDLLACCWRPTPDLLDANGEVRPEIVWAALDCPGFYAAFGEEPEPALLGELTGERFSAVPGDEALVVYAWPLGREGRKAWAGTAVATADGRVLAAARSTWIVLKTDAAN